MCINFSKKFSITWRTLQFRTRSVMVIGAELSVRVTVVVYHFVIDDIIEDFPHLSGVIKYPLSPDSCLLPFEFRLQGGG